MNNFGKALLAGLAATVVLSAMMLAKAMMGVMPELDIAKMIASMMGAPDQPAVGWAIHFLIGVVGYGLALTLFDKHLPGNHTMRGVMIAVAGWLLMMLTLMPLAGAGLFGMNLGLMAPVMTLVLHLVFGAVLGWVYGKQTVLP